MKGLWTLVKVVVALALLIPLSLILLGTAVLALRLAIFALIAYAGFKLIARLFRGTAPKSTPKQIPQLQSVDPYYTAAMRDLDRELGDPVRR